MKFLINICIKILGKLPGSAIGVRAVRKPEASRVSEIRAELSELSDFPKSSLVYMKSLSNLSKFVQKKHPHLTSPKGGAISPHPRMKLKGYIIPYIYIPGCHPCFMLLKKISFERFYCK